MPKSRIRPFYPVLVEPVEHALRTDLEGARDLEVAVELHFTSGTSMLTGLAVWPDNGVWFSVYDPKTFRDRHTTRKVFLDQVASWTVTETSYHYE